MTTPMGRSVVAPPAEGDKPDRAMEAQERATIMAVRTPLPLPHRADPTPPFLGRACAQGFQECMRSTIRTTNSGRASSHNAHENPFQQAVVDIAWTFQSLLLTDIRMLSAS